MPIEDLYFEIPIVTRSYLTAILAVTVATHLGLVSPLKLLYTYNAVFKGRQYWRLITTFLYFGPFSFDFLFHIFFLSRYARMLEEGSFRGRSLDFLWMLLLGASAILVTDSKFPRGSMHFLSSALSAMLVYVWSKRNPQINMNLMGVLNFRAPYLSWVLLGFSLLLHGNWPISDILGITFGHIYYFMDDVYPTMPGSNGQRYLRAPRFLTALLEPRDARDATIQPIPQIDQEEEDTDSQWEDLAQQVKD